MLIIIITSQCIIKTRILLGCKLNYRGDWYLFRAKFMNDSNFFVHEVGRGGGGVLDVAWMLNHGDN